MAPRIRSNPYLSPSPEPLNGKEASTSRKCKFYDTLNRDGNIKSLASISRDCKITLSCRRKWRNQKLEFGHIATRRTRKRSTKLEHKSKVTKKMYNQLVSSENLVRKQPWEAQISHFEIPCKRRQLQRMIKRHIKGGGRYKCAFIKKEISRKNRFDRTTYGETNVYKSIFEFWDHIIYTDEAHVDSTSQAQVIVTREQGTRDNPENIEERLSLKGIQFHIAA